MINPFFSPTMSCLDGFFEGQPDKWKSFCLFHTELQERMTDMWQVGLTFTHDGKVVNVEHCHEFPGGSLQIGKLLNPYKLDDPTQNTVKHLPTWTLHSFLLAWTTLNDLDHEHMAAILISRSIPRQHQTDILAKNLLTLFHHKGPEPLTKQMFINVCT